MIVIDCDLVLSTYQDKKLAMCIENVAETALYFATWLDRVITNNFLLSVN